jgi:hypothetical protein
MLGLWKSEEAPKPIWWFEGGSFPCLVVNKERVKTLVQTRHMLDVVAKNNPSKQQTAIRRYPSLRLAPVVIHFRWGFGDVIYNVSHLYLKNVDPASLTNARDKKSAKYYITTELGLDYSKVTNKFNIDDSDVILGKLETAFTSTMLIVNSILHQLKKKIPD